MPVDITLSFGYQEAYKFLIFLPIPLILYENIVKKSPNFLKNFSNICVIQENVVLLSPNLRWRVVSLVGRVDLDIF